MNSKNRIHMDNNVIYNFHEKSNLHMIIREDHTKSAGCSFVNWILTCQKLTSQDYEIVRVTYYVSHLDIEQQIGNAHCIRNIVHVILFLLFFLALMKNIVRFKNVDTEKWATFKQRFWLWFLHHRPHGSVEDFIVINYSLYPIMCGAGNNWNDLPPSYTVRNHTQSFNSMYEKKKKHSVADYKCLSWNFGRI